MKEIRKIIIALVVLVTSYFLARLVGFNMEELIANLHINLEAVLKVTMVIAFLTAIKHILKMLIGFLKNSKTATAVTLIQSALDYIAMILIVVWSLRLLGADINGVIAGLGILALIVGTSAEGIIEDMLTGIFMLFEREFKVGDIIEVDGFQGKVSEIGIRTTTLIDNSGSEKIFNNSSLKDILNRSSYKSVAVVDINLPDDTDLNKVLKADYGDIKCLGLEEIGEGLTVRFTKECNIEDVYNTRREMNKAILETFKKLGIR